MVKKQLQHYRHSSFKCREHLVSAEANNAQVLSAEFRAIKSLTKVS